MNKPFLMDDIGKKTNAEPLSKLPFHWRRGLPRHGLKILSEQPPPVGRRELTVDTKIGRLLFWRQARHGSGPGATTGQRGDRLLSDQQIREALEIVSRFWTTDPPFRDAHRTNVRDLITFILVDDNSFKAFSSCDPTDELHLFNSKLWQWATGDSSSPPT
jgi:hypothetical protein